MKKSLDDWLKDVYEFAAKASDVNRQLAFAGIAIVWIYKNPDSDPFILKKELALPILLWVISLGLDLLHYFFGSLAWTVFFDIKERQFNKNKLKNHKDITGPVWITRTCDIIFFLKISANIWAYYELIVFFLPRVSLYF